MNFAEDLQDQLRDQLYELTLANWANVMEYDAKFRRICTQVCDMTERDNVSWFQSELRTRTREETRVGHILKDESPVPTMPQFSTVARRIIAIKTDATIAQGFNALKNNAITSIKISAPRDVITTHDLKKASTWKSTNFKFPVLRKYHKSNVTIVDDEATSQLTATALHRIRTRNASRT
ncbi:hypothetical protein DYB32_010777 [Aphanomyces invadans]|uniref:Retrotransposon gag domain-containing protein n=1 Tax=Aphanomyces invadans TaxID=157072 RepID=A0A418AF25_9STRA|nr:hypothetical protein DYB32_010777 [Aphanomyces invadans]